MNDKTSKNAEAAKKLLLQLYNILQNVDSDIVGNISLQDDQIILRDGEAKVTVYFPEDELELDSIHAHVVVHIERCQQKPLDSCFTTFTGPLQDPFEYIADRWLRTAAPPILSLMCGKAVFGTRQFTGSEPWGVPRRHGYVGPLVMLAASSGKTESPADQRPLSEMLAVAENEEPVFISVSEIIGDDELHIVKLVISNMNEEHEWKRSLEFDDHSTSIEQLEWPPYSLDINTVLTPSRLHLGVIGFAVFYRPEDYVPLTDIEEIDESIERTMLFLAEASDADYSVPSLIQAGVGEKWVEEMFRFLPLAFGRFSFFLSGLPVYTLDDYFLIDQDGDYTKHDLYEEPVYRRAVIHSLSYAFPPKWKDAYEILVALSPEKTYIDKEIGNEISLSSPKVIPAIFCETNTDESVLRQTFERIRKDEIWPIETDLKRKQKKWWQFWK